MVLVSGASGELHSCVGWGRFFYEGCVQIYSILNACWNLLLNISHYHITGLGLCAKRIDRVKYYSRWFWFSYATWRQCLGGRCRDLVIFRTRHGLPYCSYLGFYTGYFWRWMYTYRRNMLPRSSGCIKRSLMFVGKVQCQSATLHDIKT